jgi:hypothetical protein
MIYISRLGWTAVRFCNLIVDLKITGENPAVWNGSLLFAEIHS